MVLLHRCPSPGLLHHLDQGSQYAGHVCQHLLAAHGIQVNMSRVGNCYGNDVVESFLATLKPNALTDALLLVSKRAVIFNYFEGWYSRRRRHSTRGYLGPVGFEHLHACDRVNVC